MLCRAREWKDMQNLTALHSWRQLIIEVRWIKFVCHRKIIYRVKNIILKYL